jgi:hypothetical protein
MEQQILKFTQSKTHTRGSTTILKLVSGSALSTNRIRANFLGRHIYEGRLKSSWTGSSAPLLCKGRL